MFTSALHERHNTILAVGGNETAIASAKPIPQCSKHNALHAQPTGVASGPLPPGTFASLVY